MPPTDWPAAYEATFAEDEPLQNKLAGLDRLAADGGPLTEPAPRRRGYARQGFGWVCVAVAAVLAVLAGCLL